MVTHVPSQTDITYGFRLKFHLPPGQIFAHVHPRRRLSLGDIQGKVYLVRIPQQRRNKFGARERYAILGKNFPTHAAAQEIGERLQLAFSLIATERRFGLDSQDRRGTSFSQAIKKTFAHEHGVQLRDDVHGLDVYAEYPPVTRFTAEAYGSVTHKIENYEDRLASFFRTKINPSQKQRLALDLYNLSHFEGTVKTRFLTLITVIEILSTRHKRPASVRALIRHFKDEAAGASLEPADLQSLSDALGALATQSIGEACRLFITEYGSADDAMYFTSCYKARSELVHRGKTMRPEAIDPTKLDELVSRLIIQSLVGKV